MNPHKIEHHAEKYGTLNDSCCESNSLPCEAPSLGPMWGMGSSSYLEDHSFQDYIFTPIDSSVHSGGVPLNPTQMPAHLSITASDSNGSTPGAFYATESHMGFPQFDHLLGSHPLLMNPKFSSEISSCKSANSHHDVYFTKQNDLCPLSESAASLPIQGKQKSRVSVNCESQSENPFEVLHQPSGDTPMDESKPKSSNKEQYLQFPSEEQMKASTYVSISTKHGSSGTASPTKTRVRWTKDLHEQFVESVNRLGGAEKATPRKILKLMGPVGLNVYHVKSHLQKYRTERFIPESAEGKSEKNSTHLDAKIGMQITEALRLQVEVQRHLRKQLKIQWKLQTRIEEHAMKLQNMLQQQQKATGDLIANRRLGTVALHDEQSVVSLGGVQISRAGDGCEDFSFMDSGREK